MKALVNGIGNICKTVIAVLLKCKDLLEIEKIYALKNTEVNDWNIEDLILLTEKGVNICSRMIKGL